MFACSTEKVQVGDVFTRHSYGTIIAVETGSYTVKNSKGEVWKVSTDIVQNEFHFAGHISDTKKISRTEVIKILHKNPRQAMEITFTKKREPKDAALLLSGGQGALTTRQWNKKVKEAMTGDERTLKGFHECDYDEHKRLRFIGYPDGMRLVDPRTITRLVVHETEYTIK